LTTASHTEFLTGPAGLAGEWFLPTSDLRPPTSDLRLSTSAFLRRRCNPGLLHLQPGVLGQEGPLVGVQVDQHLHLRAGAVAGAGFDPHQLRFAAGLGGLQRGGVLV